MLRRLLLVAIAALALASPAAAFSKQDGTQAMDDGVSIAFTRYTPDGAAPAGGWPGVMVLHGLGGNRGTVDQIATTFATAGYSVLAYDARGHGASGGDVTLAGPREVADLRALRQSYGARVDVHDTKIGAWGISYGGGQIWNALAAGVPFAAVEVVETWTSLYDALWPQNLARSGIVAGLAQSVAARSPLITGLRDNAIQSTNMPAIQALADARSALPHVGRITTPVYLFQGRVDYVFDIAQASRAFAALRGPKKLYVGNFGHTPSTFPGADRAYVAAQGIAWYDRFLNGTQNGVGAKKVVIAKQGAANARAELTALPKLVTRVFPFAGGPNNLRGDAGFIRPFQRPLRLPLETWGGGEARVFVSKLSRYPRLVVTVLAGSQVIAHGAVKPVLGENRVRLTNYCVYVREGTRLRLAVGPSSPTGQFAYLGFGDSGSARIGTMHLLLSTLAKPVSG